MDELSTVSFCRKLRKTKAETVLWMHLRGNRVRGLRFRRQHPIGPFIADFACVKARFIVEVDGDTHASAEARGYDARRTRYLNGRGWRERRFRNEAALSSLDWVLEEIGRELDGSVSRGGA